MARPITLKFFRADIVKKKLEALPYRMTEPVRAAMREGGQMIVDRAKMLVPVDEGVLRDSIRAEFIRSGGRKNVPLLKVGPSAEYLEKHKRIPMLARWIEFGTRPAAAGQTHRISVNKRGRITKRRRAKLGAHRGTPAHPYIFPAWRQLKKQVRGLIAKAVNKVLKETAAK